MRILLCAWLCLFVCFILFCFFRWERPVWGKGHYYWCIHGPVLLGASWAQNAASVAISEQLNKVTHVAFCLHSRRCATPSCVREPTWRDKSIISTLFAIWRWPLTLWPSSPAHGGTRQTTDLFGELSMTVVSAFKAHYPYILTTKVTYRRFCLPLNGRGDDVTNDHRMLVIHKIARFMFAIGILLRYRTVVGRQMLLWEAGLTASPYSDSEVSLQGAGSSVGRWPSVPWLLTRIVASSMRWQWWRTAVVWF